MPRKRNDLQLEHTRPNAADEGKVEGPYDVVVTDILLPTVLNALIQVSALSTTSALRQRIRLRGECCGAQQEHSRGGDREILAGPAVGPLRGTAPCVYELAGAARGGREHDDCVRAPGGPPQLLLTAQRVWAAPVQAP